MQLIQMSQPKNVMLVHGESRKMAALKLRIQTELKIPCFDPANGQTMMIKTEKVMPIAVSASALRQLTSSKKSTTECLLKSSASTSSSTYTSISTVDSRLPFVGVIQHDASMNSFRFYDRDEAKVELGLQTLTVCQQLRKTFDPLKLRTTEAFKNIDPRERALLIIAAAFEKFAKLMEISCKLEVDEKRIIVGTVSVRLANAPDCAMYLEWTVGSEALATRMFTIMGAALHH